MHPIFQKSRRSLQPMVMGILNVTPDSFSDGGRFNSIDRAIRHAESMVESGADIIDIGGESTRPGAAVVSMKDELDRVIPLIESVKSFGVPISVDTNKPEVMEASVKAGASMINDVRALQEANAMQCAADLNVPVCLMHMQGQPRTMQTAPTYANVVNDIMDFFASRIEACKLQGIRHENLCIDPGFGFGKLLEHNVDLLKHLERFKHFNLPILVGMSRKNMIGQMTGKDVDQRLAGSLAVAMIAAINGANVIRVHDVAETVDVMKIFKTVYNKGNSNE